MIIKRFNIQPRKKHAGQTTVITALKLDYRQKGQASNTTASLASNHEGAWSHNSY